MVLLEQLGAVAGEERQTTLHGTPARDWLHGWKWMHVLHGGRTQEWWAACRGWDQQVGRWEAWLARVELSGGWDWARRARRAGAQSAERAPGREKTRACRTR